MHKVLILFITLFWSGLVFSQDTLVKPSVYYEKDTVEYEEYYIRERDGEYEEAEETIEYDYVDEEYYEVIDYPVESRSYKKPLAEKYNSSEFDYTEKVKKKQKPITPPSLDLSFINVIGKILMYLLIALAVLSILYFLYLLITGQQINSISFSRKKIKTKLKSTNQEENIEDIADNDFDKLMQKAETNQDYRLAFRYQFLSVLQLLDDKKIIAWKKDKTNSDYITEITKEEFKESFSYFAYLYDYVWYGLSKIDKEEYQSLKEIYKNTKNKI